MEANCDKHGLLQPLPGGFWLFLGDWITPHGDEGSDSPEALLFNNCYYLYVTRLVTRIARVLGETGDVSAYTSRANLIADAINQRFYNAKLKTYLDSKQGHCIMPLISGAVQERLTGEVMKNLENEINVVQNGHIDTGLHGTYFMTKYLTEHDRSDLIYTYMTQTTHPSYGDMLAKGYETWPEYWGGSDSKMHGCLNGIGGWFQRGLAGIRPDPAAPGYKRFIVKPAIVGDLTRVKASHVSMYGEIRSDWELKADKFILTTQVPANAIAHIYLPTAAVDHITEGGLPLSQVKSVKVVGAEGDRTVIEAGAGRYRFVVKGMATR